jgi:hypothetical protein
MVKVFYNGKTNAWLAGVLFSDGIAKFEDDVQGVAFAEQFYLKFELSTPDPEPAKKAIPVKEGA